MSRTKPTKRWRVERPRKHVARRVCLLDVYVAREFVSFSVKGQEDVAVKRFALGHVDGVMTYTFGKWCLVSGPLDLCMHGQDML